MVVGLWWLLNCGCWIVVIAELWLLNYGCCIVVDAGLLSLLNCGC